MIKHEGLEEFINKKTFLRNWIDISITSQYELQKEYNKIEFPQWNKGYLEALLDVKEILFSMPIENEKDK